MINMIKLNALYDIRPEQLASLFTCEYPKFKTFPKNYLIFFIVYLVAFLPAAQNVILAEKSLSRAKC